jgi:hypothetical protein
MDGFLFLIDENWTEKVIDKADGKKSPDEKTDGISR